MYLNEVIIIQEQDGAETGSSVTIRENIAGVGRCTLVSAGFFSFVNSV